MVDLVGLAIPFAYLAVLVGSLATFSSLYRKRKLGGFLYSEYVCRKLREPQQDQRR